MKRQASGEREQLTHTLTEYVDSARKLSMVGHALVLSSEKPAVQGAALSDWCGGLAAETLSSETHQ